MAVEGLEFLEDFGVKLEDEFNDIAEDSILTVANKMVKLLQESDKGFSKFSTANLERSISVLPIEKTSDGWVISIQWEDYGTYQDAGVSGTESGTSLGSQLGYGKNFKYTNSQPPAHVFEQYAKANGVSPYAIAKSIFKKGIKATKWASNTIESREFDALLDNIAELIVNQYEE